MVDAFSQSLLFSSRSKGVRWKPPFDFKPAVGTNVNVMRIVLFLVAKLLIRYWNVDPELL